MVDFTFVVPVFNLTDKRLRNFLFIISRMSECDNKIIVIEQESGHELNLNLENNIKLIKIKSSEDVIEKSKLINESLKYVDTSYVWINDADIWLPFKKIVSCLKNMDEDCIKPFLYFFLLDENETSDFISRKVIVPRISTHRTIKNYGAGSFIIKKNVLQSEPFNEIFRGWGYEDIEWERRIKSKKEVSELPYIGLHLFHEKNRAHRMQNRKNYRNLINDCN